MNNFLALLNMVPAILKVVKAIEVEIPISGKGKEKLEMVKGILEAGYEGVSEMMPMIEKIIGIAVKAFNTMGVFKK